MCWFWKVTPFARRLLALATAPASPQESALYWSWVTPTARLLVPITFDRSVVTVTSAVVAAVVRPAAPAAAVTAAARTTARKRARRSAVRST
jgi:hypothetical protein